MCKMQSVTAQILLALFLAHAAHHVAHHSAFPHAATTAGSAHVAFSEPVSPTAQQASLANCAYAAGTHVMVLDRVVGRPPRFSASDRYSGKPCHCRQCQNSQCRQGEHQCAHGALLHMEVS